MRWTNTSSWDKSLPTSVPVLGECIATILSYNTGLGQAAHRTAEIRESIRNIVHEIPAMLSRQYIDILGVKRVN